MEMEDSSHEKHWHALGRPHLSYLNGASLNPIRKIATALMCLLSTKLLDADSSFFKYSDLWRAVPNNPTNSKELQSPSTCKNISYSGIDPVCDSTLVL